MTLEAEFPESGTSALTQLRTLASAGLDWEIYSNPLSLAGRGAVEAAVLLLFGPASSFRGAAESAGPTETDILFVERAGTLRDHPGQVAFPGGRVDPDDAGAVGAALREAWEETGLNPRGVDVLGTFSSLPLPVSNYQVTPVLGWWRSPSPIYPVDQAESARVFRVPVGHLANPEFRRTALMTRHGSTYAGPAFLAEGTVIWGFTAVVLSGLLTALGWDQPWDTARTVEVLP